MAPCCRPHLARREDSASFPRTSLLRACDLQFLWAAFKEELRCLGNRSTATGLSRAQGLAFGAVELRGAVWHLGGSGNSCPAPRSKEFTHLSFGAVPVGFCLPVVKSNVGNVGTDQEPPVSESTPNPTQAACHDMLGPQIYKNSHIVLRRINSKPALYQPQPASKKP